MFSMWIISSPLGPGGAPAWLQQTSCNKNQCTTSTAEALSLSDWMGVRALRKQQGGTALIVCRSQTGAPPGSKGDDHRVPLLNIGGLL